MESKIASVASTVGVDPSASLPIRFVENGKGGNEKAPKHRYQISLPAPLTGLVLEGPIFSSQVSTGTVSYAVGLPGGRFPAIKAAQAILEHEGQCYYLSEPDPNGMALLDRWAPAIKEAYLTYLETRTAEQRITL